MSAADEVSTLVTVSVQVCRPCLDGAAACPTPGCVLHGADVVTDEGASLAVGRAVLRQGAEARS